MLAIPMQRLFQCFLRVFCTIREFCALLQGKIGHQVLTTLLAIEVVVGTTMRRS